MLDPNLISQENFVTKKQLKRRFLIDKPLIREFFPLPQKITNKNKQIEAWPIEIVERIMCNPDFIEAYYAIRDREDDGDERAEVRAKLLKLSSTKFMTISQNKSRRFILHIGPTNSGKTYNAIQALQRAQSGVYLGPLRLLALEIFDKLNLIGTPCSLLTGEEQEKIPCSRVISSTIEMCDYSKHYDIAVIDECQMIADEDRGSHWTRALFQIDADEIHLCLAPEAKELITSFLSKMDLDYAVNSYERLTPLNFGGVFHHISDVQPGDALIAFSRKKVLAIAAELEEMGTKTSVIYGGLPPVARREEVRRFNEGESNVVVATDAIGMGVTLPIKRIIFCETEKRDLSRSRVLTASEIKQIAGRAGRYGKYENGEVLTFQDPGIIRSALENDIEPIKRMTVPFPRELITSNSNIEMYLAEWEALLLSPSFKRQRMSDSLYLLRKLGDQANEFGNDALFRLITCPFDTTDKRLVGYWLRCCVALKNNDDLPVPYFDESDLSGCEVQYKAHEIRYRLSLAFKYKDDLETEKQRLCIKINRLLVGSKSMFIPRCKECGKRLPITIEESLCEDCKVKQFIKKFVQSSNHTGATTLGSIAKLTRWNK